MTEDRVLRAYRGISYEALRTVPRFPFVACQN
jgi:hypothetical protein